jgi:hypothetical protein
MQTFSNFMALIEINYSSYFKGKREHPVGSSGRIFD